MADQPTLHARILARIDELDQWQIGDDSRADVSFARDYGQARAALRAVVELHKPQDTWPSGVTILGAALCFGCDFDGYDGEDPEWPCTTIRAIARELGITEEARRA